MIARFRFTESDGKTVTGPVQGNGGLVTSLARLLKAQRLANDYLDTGLYEPSRGRVCVFPDWTPRSNGPRVYVSLRTATIEAVPIEVE